MNPSAAILSCNSLALNKQITGVEEMSEHFLNTKIKINKNEISTIERFVTYERRKSKR